MTFNQGRVDEQIGTVGLSSVDDLPPSAYCPYPGIVARRVDWNVNIALSPSAESPIPWETFNTGKLAVW